MPGQNSHHQRQRQNRHQDQGPKLLPDINSSAALNNPVFLLFSPFATPVACLCRRSYNRRQGCFGWGYRCFRCHPAGPFGELQIAVGFYPGLPGKIPHRRMVAHNCHLNRPGLHCAGQQLHIHQALQGLVFSRRNQQQAFDPPVSRS
ncbi:MAG: hypothetical protein HC875_03305 [Anaerolineales bacterium]|nr:hypothetical protein [Anaerolineales bacterium]